MIGRKKNRQASSIDEVFARCAKEKRAAFIPYLTAGDPHLDRTPALLESLVAGGADLIELGVPFSDPIADGPVNQRAAYRALRAGTTLSGILEVVSGFRRKHSVPVVLFTYFNPIHARGVESFAEQARSSGVDGVLCVDLPPEEGVEHLGAALDHQGVCSVYLLAPTSTRDRVRAVARASRGFVYYVSRIGVTGEQAQLSSSLVKEVRRVRRQLSLPLAVGFGISSAEQVRSVGRVADGVVVGSALVRLVEEHGEAADLPQRLEARVAELSGGLRR